jgi:hypothetical protein
MSEPVTVPWSGWVSIKVHRILAQHGPGEQCPDCPTLCNHCGHVGKQGDDHTCPCPYNDADCPNHPPLTDKADQEGERCACHGLPPLNCPIRGDG